MNEQIAKNATAPVERCPSCGLPQRLGDGEVELQIDVTRGQLEQFLADADGDNLEVSFRVPLQAILDSTRGPRGVVLR